MLGEVSFLSSILKPDPIKPWFEAVEATGDYVMIRFGQIKPGADEVDWMDVPHAEFDGIGGFGNILRSRGVDFGELPINKHLRKPSWIPFLKSLPKQLKSRKKLEWKSLGESRQLTDEDLPVPATSWHVFSEEDTECLRKASREEGVTLNSFLLKQLDSALREDLKDGRAGIPWMIPVNLRGQIDRKRDIDNHTSYLSVTVNSDESVQEVHAEIYRKLSIGEHWANWKAYAATRFMPAFLKRLMVRSGRATSEWNLGVFSNLGNWDPEKEIQNEGLSGAWLFGAPVLRFQTVSAGAMTFQGRLGLTIQAHPELTVSRETVDRWMENWRTGLMAQAKQ